MRVHRNHVVKVSDSSQSEILYLFSRLLLLLILLMIIIIFSLLFSLTIREKNFDILLQSAQECVCKKS